MSLRQYSWDFPEIFFSRQFKIKLKFIFILLSNELTADVVISCDA